MQSIKSTLSASAARTPIVGGALSKEELHNRRDNAIRAAEKAVADLHKSKKGDQSQSIKLLAAVLTCVATGAFPRYNGNDFGGDGFTQWRNDQANVINRGIETIGEEIAKMAAEDRKVSPDVESTRHVKRVISESLLIAIWLTRVNARDTATVSPHGGRTMIVSVDAFNTFAAKARREYLSDDTRDGSRGFPFSKLYNAARDWANLKTGKSRSEKEETLLNNAAKLIATLYVKAEGAKQAHAPRKLCDAADKLAEAIAAYATRKANDTTIRAPKESKAQRAARVASEEKAAVA